MVPPTFSPPFNTNSTPCFVVMCSMMILRSVRVQGNQRMLHEVGFAVEDVNGRVRRLAVNAEGHLQLRHLLLHFNTGVDTHQHIIDVVDVRHTVLTVCRGASRIVLASIHNSALLGLHDFLWRRMICQIPARSNPVESSYSVMRSCRSLSGANSASIRFLYAIAYTVNRIQRMPILVVIGFGMTFGMTRNRLYTGLTRASELYFRKGTENYTMLLPSRRWTWKSSGRRIRRRVADMRWSWEQNRVICENRSAT